MRHICKFQSASRRTNSKKGFTMIELLVALAIIALIIVLMMFGQGITLSRGEDARRKEDLAKLKIAFEDYYNDHNCYPAPALLQRCNSNDLAPYMAKVPCDPKTKTPYPYYWDSTCNWYAAYTTLGDQTDPVISTLGCSPTCGVPNQSFNYIQTNGKLTPAQIASQISSGAVSLISATPTPTPRSTPTAIPTATPTQLPTPTATPIPSPTPTPVPGNLACDPSGRCNVYSDAVASGCPVTFADLAVCQSFCDNVANRCLK